MGGRGGSEVFCEETEVEFLSSRGSAFWVRLGRLGNIGWVGFGRVGWLVGLADPLSLVDRVFTEETEGDVPAV